MATPEPLHVEVAYARADRQFVIPLELPAGATLADAIHASGLLASCPEIDLDRQRVGARIRDFDLQRFSRCHTGRAPGA